MSSKKNMKMVARPKGKGKKDPVRHDFQYVVKLCDRVKSLQTSYFRRFCASGSVSTTAGGAILVQQLGGSANVSGYNDFASVATLYTQYRVRAMKATLYPTYSRGTSVIVPSMVVIPFRGGNVPTTLAQFIDSSENRVVDGYTPHTFTTEWKGDLDAHLWTSTSGAVSSSENFGLVLIGFNAGAAGITAQTSLVEFVVEFRVAQ